jgi:hypothetical protein
MFLVTWALKNTCKTASRFIVVALLSISQYLAASPDIQVSSPIREDIAQVSYTLVVDDCVSVATVQAGTTAALQNYSVAQARRDIRYPTVCLIFPFQVLTTCSLQPG